MKPDDSDNPLENSYKAMTFDRAKLTKLKARIARAEAAGSEQFVFDGHKLLVSYARYLAEYADGRLRGSGR